MKYLATQKDSRDSIYFNIQFSKNVFEITLSIVTKQLNVSSSAPRSFVTFKVPRNLPFFELS